MRIEKIKNNQFIIKEANAIYFVSYESTVAKIDKKGVLTLGSDWDYSQTTLKYLYVFIQKNDCFLNAATCESLEGLALKTNKKEYLQKLIDSKIIKYSESL